MENRRTQTEQVRWVVDGSIEMAKLVHDGWETGQSEYRGGTRYIRMTKNREEVDRGTD